MMHKVLRISLSPETSSRVPDKKKKKIDNIWAKKQVGGYKVLMMVGTYTSGRSHLLSEREVKRKCISKESGRTLVCERTRMK